MRRQALRNRHTHPISSGWPRMSPSGAVGGATCLWSHLRGFCGYRERSARVLLPVKARHATGPADAARLELRIEDCVWLLSDHTGHEAVPARHDRASTNAGLLDSRIATHLLLAQIPVRRGPRRRSGGLNTRGPIEHHTPVLPSGRAGIQLGWFCLGSTPYGRCVCCAGLAASCGKRSARGAAPSRE